MDAQVKVIEKKYFLYRDAPKKGTSDEEFRKGKRADHDQLPEEIQARYVENLPLLQRMREVHLKLRNLSLENVSCPDSERYPFLKELIELDKRIHENWDIYDHYVLGTPVPDTSKAKKSTSKGNKTAAKGEKKASKSKAKKESKDSATKNTE